MNIEQYREYCLLKNNVEESFPFDEFTLVFKIGNKMFSLMGLDQIENPTVNLKGDPEQNIEYREKYEGIKPGFHMNKTHWNTVNLDTDVSDKLIKEMTDKSYNLVVKSLSIKLRKELGLI
jgi:predicted DNA-binding protein (MmcQ/YjbR family)